MSVDQCRLIAPGFLHAISLGYMHSMLSLDRAYLMDELEGLIVF